MKAFQFAHEADPDAQLYYNDYSLDNAPKRNGAVALVKRLQAAGVPIYAVGSQSHDKMDWPSVAQVDSTIRALSGAGVKVNITELDIDVLPPATREPERRRRDARPGVGRRQPVRRRAPRLGAARARRAVRRPVSCFCIPSGRHRPRYLLGRRRWRLVAQQLARPRTDQLSVVVRPRRSPEAGVRRGDVGRRPRSSAVGAAHWRRPNERRIRAGPEAELVRQARAADPRHDTERRLRTGRSLASDHGDGQAVRRRPPDDSRSAQEVGDDGHRRDSPRLGRLREPQRGSPRAGEPGLPRHGHQEASPRSHRHAHAARDEVRRRSREERDARRPCRDAAAAQAGRRQLRATTSC